MISPFLPVESGFDVRKQADRLGVSLWRTSTSLFVFLGGVTILFMIGIFFTFPSAEDMEMMLSAEIMVVIVMLLLGGLVIRLLEELAVTSKLKADFISTTAHKLKSPLSQIKWYIELFRGKGVPTEGNDAFIETLQKIDIANEQLIRMVDDFLSVSHIDNGATHMYEEKMDIMLLIRRVCSRYQSGAEEKRVRLVVQPFQGDGKIWADERKIEVVVDNLILNALYYTDRSGSITVELVDRGEELEVHVTDTGIGIPTVYQGRIFEKFFRADNAVSVNGEGSGLGLYLCQKIVRQIGGRIWFQSKEKSGSTFYVAFPRKR